MTDSINNFCILETKYSPLSGSEPAWNPEAWKENKKYNNCYAYAVNDHKDRERMRKPTPGTNRDSYSCSEIMEGLYRDISNIYPTTFNCKCNYGYSKIYAAVSDGDDNDFHFWRLDNDGNWSHKLGSNDPSRNDAKGIPITNPEQSDKDFGDHNYTYGCGFFCVPVNHQLAKIDHPSNNNRNNNNNNN